MFAHLDSMTVLAQDGPSPIVGLALTLLTLFCVLVLPFIFGQFVANRLRMADYWWKIGVMISAFACAGLIIFRAYDFKDHRFVIPLGVDLKGGVILVYQVESRSTVAKLMEETGQSKADLVEESGLSQQRVSAIISGNTKLTGAERDKISRALKRTPGEIDWQEPESGVESRFDMSELIQAVTNRINPSGTQEIVVRPYGDRQIEIIIPDVGNIEVERIKRRISTAGALEFRIVANQTDHQSIIQLARQQAEDADLIRRRSRDVLDSQGVRVGYWARAVRDAKKPGRPFKEEGITGDVLRNANTGELVNPAQFTLPMQENESAAQWLERNGITDVEVLMAVNDDLNVTGDYLGSVAKDVDNSMNPCVRFAMNGRGAVLFGQLTGNNLPDRSTGFHRRLGIVLDGNLLSAPRILSRISDSGQITGSFTDEEVTELVDVLRAGKLPATLQKQPISENQIGSMLGDDTIQRGKLAIGFSLLAVVVFVLIYYRFAGIVACIALLGNLVLIIGMMILLKAPLTLPGLAGLVLTVGMSVDANVLIFERIREELNRGSALRMAIRNGFARATTTIVDANLTTLITAIVLYVIGTDQVKGFAVTLIFGILMSMFTAIFCSRMFFEIAERSRRLKKLSMMQILGATQIDFIGKRMVAGIVSAILIVVGVIAVFQRGRDIFDIDFNGGSSVTFLVNDTSITTTDVRDRMEKELAGTPYSQFSVHTVSVQGEDSLALYKIDSSIEKVEDLQQHVISAFKEGTGTKLQTYAMTIKDTKQVVLQKPSVSPPASNNATEANEPASEKAAEGSDSGATTGEPKAGKSDEGKSDEGKSDEGKSDEGNSGEGNSDEGKSDEGGGDATKQGAEDPNPPKQQNPPPQADQAGLNEPEWIFVSAVQEPASDPTVDPSLLRTVATVSFAYKINAPTLRESILQVAEKENIPITDLVIELTEADPDWTQESAVPYGEFKVTLPLGLSDGENLLNKVQESLEGAPIWESSSNIGGKVASDTQEQAVYALIISLLFIVGYIWLRFQKVFFGVAAVIALVHDVLITLGAIAASAFVADALGFLLIEDFKISLPVVAAFLTIVGYSLNDTIVVFDRIREVRGKSPDLSAEMINTSINQTLSRTLLTSVTTLIVVLILYFGGGQGIHGFAFALVVGVIVGTYSSIFVASPALLWMMNLAKKRAEAGKDVRRSAKSA